MEKSKINIISATITKQDKNFIGTPGKLNVKMYIAHNDELLEEDDFADFLNRP